jgi:hypothetical protein
MIRTRNYDRNHPPTSPTDWTEPKFGWVFVLFMLNWVFSQLWHNIVYYWIGALTNSPQKCTHYVGVFRGVLGAGEAICFGLDSIKIPFIAEAGGILLFYVLGIASFYYLGIYHIRDTNYDRTEEGAVVPNHILEKEGLTPGQEPAADIRGGAVEKGKERVAERESEKFELSGGEKV